MLNMFVVSDIFLECCWHRNTFYSFNSKNENKYIGEYLYVRIPNKHNQKLINIVKNQNIYGGFLKILIIRVSLSRTHLQSKTFLFTGL